MLPKRKSDLMSNIHRLMGWLDSSTMSKKVAHWCPIIRLLLQRKWKWEEKGMRFHWPTATSLFSFTSKFHTKSAPRLALLFVCYSASLPLSSIWLTGTCVLKTTLQVVLVIQWCVGKKLVLKALLVSNVLWEPWILSHEYSNFLKPGILK